MGVGVFSIGCGPAGTHCSNDGEYWIGLVKDGALTTTDGWRWLDGSEYDWQNWYSGGEPGQYDTVVRMLHTGEWKHNQKTNAFNYICRKDTLPEGMVF